MATEISKVIFQLDVEAKGVASEMAKVASAMTGVTKEVAHQTDELKKLQDKELGLIEIRKKASNPSAIINLTKAIEKNRAEIDKVAKSQSSLNKDVNAYSTELKGLPGKLDKAFNKQVVASFEKQVAEVTAEQKKLNETIADKKPLSGLQALKKEYKDLVSAAISAGENTDIGRNFLKQAGEVKDRIADIQQTTKNFGSDTAVFDGLIGATQGVAAGFEIAQGAAALFGNENQDVQKALLKVNAAMAIANGLQQIQALLQKESAFRIQATAAAQKIYNFAVGEGTKGTKILNATLKVGAVGAVIFLLQKFSKEIESLGQKIKDSQIGKFVNDLFGKSVDEKQQDALTKQIEGSKLAIENVENEYRRKIELAKANKEDTEALEQEKLNKQLAIINDVNSEILGATKGHLFSLTAEQKKAAAELIEQTKDLNNEVAVINAEAVQKRLEELRQIAEADKKLAREIQDIEIALIKDKRDREVAEINIQAERRVSELLETKASKEKIAEATIAIEKERLRKIEELEDISLKKRELAFSDSMKKRDEIIPDNRIVEDPQDAKDFAKLQEQRRKDKVASEIEGINTITQAAANAAQSIIAIEIEKQNKLFEIQNKRVAQAALIADRGNAEILQQEQERLDAIQKKREAFVRAQQILQQVEIVGNSIVAVSKAAAQGGVAAPATIAATIAALIAGFALVRTLTQPEGFREGGYTGDGDPSDTSNRLGHRGYKYHKKEFVMNEKLTSKNLSTFKKIHSGELDLSDTMAKAKMFDSIPMPLLNNLLMGQSIRNAHNNIDTSRLETIMGSVEKAIKSKPDVAFNINEKGFQKYWSQVIYKNERIKNSAK